MYVYRCKCTYHGLSPNGAQYWVPAVTPDYAPPFGSPQVIVYPRYWSGMLGRTHCSCPHDTRHSRHCRDCHGCAHGFPAYQPAEINNSVVFNSFLCSQYNSFERYNLMVNSSMNLCRGECDQQAVCMCSTHLQYGYICINPSLVFCFPVVVVVVAILCVVCLNYFLLFPFLFLLCACC